MAEKVKGHSPYLHAFPSKSKQEIKVIDFLHPLVAATALTTKGPPGHIG